MDEYKVEFGFGRELSESFFKRTVTVQVPIGSERNDIILAALKVVGSYPRTYKVVDMKKV